MALVACGEGPADDADGDGVPADRDCDDTDPDVAPGRTEICDGIDQDCDGEVDEGVLRDYFVDEDRDGYGSTPAQACAPTPTLSITGGDCDDGDAGVRPGALETCDGVDQDCDDAVDEEASDATLWAPDADEDGFGSPTGLVRACEAPTGFVVDTTDCDDTDPTEYPGQVWYRDADADTFGDAGAVRLCARGAATDVQEAGDCDDGNAAVNPEGVEVCNTLDDDCDGAKDEPDAVDALTFYTDADKDGFGDAKTAARACVASDGQVLDATDCDDADATEYPGILWYPDVDGDGFGALGATPAACARAAITDVVDRTDCDDTRGTSFPGAEERCNDQDDDCDGTTDEPEAVDAATWYRDSDGDGFGDASATSIACDAPTGFLADDTDCDDRSRGVNPAAKERCDDVDEDCDGDIDEDAVDRDPYYADVDKDGYGDPGDVVFSCDEVVGRIEDDSDCDDTDAKRYPGVSWYPDEDGDGFGDGEATPADCEPSDPSDVLDKTDCDDTEADYKPGVFWYADADGDGYGDPTLETECARPSGAT